MKLNECGFRPPVCTTRLTRPGEPAEDSEMNGFNGQCSLLSQGSRLSFHSFYFQVTCYD